MSNKYINEDTEIYDGSEMDKVKSPPFTMILLFLLLTAIGFGYSYLWELLLTT